ncbi:MAG: fibronectin type III domain-containing protein [Spirochaetota bacterium]
MRTTVHRIVTGIAAVALVAMVAGCGSPLESPVASVDVRKEQAPEGSRSIVPPESNDPVEYRVSGTGPGNATFSETYSAVPVDVGGLAVGEWTITVEGLAENGEAVLQGSTVVFVSGDGTTPVEVTLSPAVGEGDVSIELTWPTLLVRSPHVVAILERDGADDITLDADVRGGEGTAVCSAQDIPSGWYRLRLQLRDGEISVAGRAELVQVAANVTTSGDVEISELNKPGQPVNVTGSSFTLAWDDRDPGDPVASYNVYYRSHGSYEWIYLGTTGDATTSYEVTTSLLDHGSYDFAVTAVSESGEESEPHTSLCDDADPETGWFVEWQA